MSVIRISGPNSVSVAEGLCGGLEEPWKFKHCKIKKNDGVVLDTGLVVFFKSPHSYTGEDVVEGIEPGGEVGGERKGGRVHEEDGQACVQRR